MHASTNHMQGAGRRLLAAEGAGHKPFAWAGYCSLVPEAFRLTKATGHADNGRIVLSDDERNRLEMAWGSVRRRHIDPRKMFIKRLRTEHDIASDDLDLQIRRVDHPGFDPLLTWSDEERQIDHYLGYAEHTRRIVHLTYQRENAQQTQQFRDVFLRQLVDQPLDEPQLWAFFSVSFLAPPQYRHAEHTLNVGNMTVQLRNKTGWYHENRLLVRQIYPARLALGRKDLEAHAKAWLLEKSDVYRPRLRWLRLKRTPVVDAMNTSLGPAYTARSHLRWLVRPFLWRWPRRKRMWLVHDHQRDRLILLELGEKKYPEPGRVEQLIEGMHWATPQPPAEGG